MRVEFPLKVALIDDDIDAVMYMKKILSGVEDIVVTHYDDPRAALSAYTTEKFNIIIVDINMPYLAGEMLLGEINALPGRTDVIVVSKVRSLMIANTCYQEGATFFIEKPIQKKELLAAIDFSIRRFIWWGMFFRHLLETLGEERTKGSKSEIYRF